MTSFPVLNTALVNSIKHYMDNIKNDVDPHKSMDDIADLVDDNRLLGKDEYKPLLRSVCDLLRQKGYPSTADFLTKQWQL
jgi:hypothetical protein